jgi:hypothetical protein
VAVTVVERNESRRRSWGERLAATVRYNVLGTADETEAGAALASAAPVTRGGLVRLGYDVDELAVDESSPAACTWLGTVEYGVPTGSAPEPLDVGDVVVTASTLGGQEHITAPIARLGAYPPDTAPQAHGIGDNGRGEVEGVDIAARALELEVVKVFESAAVAPSPGALWALATTTNNAPFSITDSKTGRQWSFAAGELLFLGHREGRARVDGALEITYHFAASPNRTDITIPGTGITVASKPGWAYLWLRWEQAEDADKKRMYAKALAAYVDRVYYEGNFAALGI